MAQNIEGAWPDIGQLIANNLKSAKHNFRDSHYYLAKTHLPAAGSGLFPAPTPFSTRCSGSTILNQEPLLHAMEFRRAARIESSTTVDVNYVGRALGRLNVGGYYNTALTPGAGECSGTSAIPYIAPTFYDRSIGNGTTTLSRSK